MSVFCRSLRAWKNSPLIFVVLQSKPRRSARVVESDGLENRYRSNPIEGSNPSFSATQVETGYF